ncbi:MAG: hypothetical protein ACYC0M_10795 [Burkholderiales bacterium]
MMQMINLEKAAWWLSVICASIGGFLMFIHFYSLDTFFALLPLLIVFVFVTVLLLAIIFRKQIAREYRAALNFSPRKKLWVVGVCAAIGLFISSPGLFGALLGIATAGGSVLWFIVAAATSSSGGRYTSSSSIGSGSYKSSIDVNPATGLSMVSGTGGVDIGGNSFGSNSSSSIDSGSGHMGGF